MTRPDYWLTKFSKLRVDRARGDPAPHKPLLLLLLFDLVEQGGSQTPKGRGLRQPAPTRVGTTQTPARKSAALSVHPHARGDNRAVASPAAPASGSPPRAWGQLDFHGLCRSPRRFTPTRVGTTPCSKWLWVVRPVHPHARGDNWPYLGWRSPLGGSPPRAWGQLTPRPG